MAKDSSEFIGFDEERLCTEWLNPVEKVGINMAETLPKKFFFYGTLKNAEHPQSTRTPDCTVKGYALWKWEHGWYPLALPHKRGIIHGTLHDFSIMKAKDFENYLRSTDGYEGAYGEHPLYFRMLVTVNMPDKSKQIAYMYVFNKKKSHTPMFRIPQGLWENSKIIKIWNSPFLRDSKEVK